MPYQPISRRIFTAAVLCGAAFAAGAAMHGAGLLIPERSNPTRDFP